MTEKQNKRTPIELLQEFSIPLIAGVWMAVVWANYSPNTYQALIHWSPLGHGNHYNFHFLVNDLFMALFFGIAAKEITEACLPGGALNPIKKAINPLLGTLGGVLGPISIYFLVVHLTGDQKISNGWGIPTATDIALAWLVARIVFGKGHPAVSFLLLLAVADDALGLGIIAVFYPNPAHPVQPAYLLLVVFAMAMAYGFRKAGKQDNEKSYWPFMFCGAISWLGLYMAHLHPALALVPIVPFMPNMGHDDGLFAEESSGKKYHDTLNKFEHAFKKPVDFGLLFFGLANAGVALSSVGNATWAVLFGLLVGKTLGITLFSSIGRLIGFPLPDGMNTRSLFTAGMVAGLGLTVALFVAGVAFTDATLMGAAKMGALLSAGAAPIAVMFGWFLQVKHKKKAEPRQDAMIRSKANI